MGQPVSMVSNSLIPPLWLPTTGTPTAIAVEPGTGVVYVTNAADATVSVLEAD